MNRPARILLADGDPRAAAALAAYLEARGFQVRAEGRIDAALESVRGVSPDLVLAEAELPALGGLDLCRRLRAADFDGPLLLFARRGGDDYDKVLGLELGADGWLGGALEPRVLVAHVGAMLRRREMARSPQARESLRFGALLINRGTREVRWCERRIAMSSAEFELLWLLASHAGEVLPHAFILHELRGLQHAHEDRSMDARLYRLRRRFGDEARAARRIRSVRPRGYMFSNEPW